MAEGEAVRRSGLFVWPIVGVVLIVVAFATLVSLGNWQMRRLQWKENLLSEIETRRHAPPAEFTDVAAIARAGQDVDYRPVRVSGTFLNDKERHFFATYDGSTGYYIYTPLRLDDGELLFVNRGFVPFDSKEPEMRKQGQLTGEQTVIGLARDKLLAKPSWAVPDNDIAKNIFYWKDLDAMASSIGLDPARVVPFFVDADATPNPGGLPVGGVTQFDLPNNHLQYALTWYGLAGALAAVSAVFFLRRIKGL